MQWRIAAVLPHLRGRVLDVGCGTNELLLRYRRDSEQPGAIDSVGIDVFDWPGADLLVEDSPPSITVPTARKCCASAGA